MDRRSRKKFRPGLARVEARVLPAALTAVDPPHAAIPSASSGSSAVTIFRITNPTPTNAILVPPLGTVRVQKVEPKVGGTYNILFVTMRNGTNRTYTAADDLSVTTTGDPQTFPVLTGDQTWKPNQVLIFYLLSKKYYPLSPQYSAGFVFRIDGSIGTAIPGPSGIFLGVRYNPATIDRILNYAAINGPRTRDGLHRLGIGDTALWEFKPARGPGASG